MESALASSPSDRQLPGPAWLQEPTVASLVFAFKTYAASLLGLFIAFWAGLDDPRWAFLTVFIVSQPDSGLVLAKGFYRILGTIGGLLVTIPLVFAFCQYGELFLAAAAAWICLCSFASRAVRSFASYGFQLAGYTVAIVGIPAALNPSGAYQLVLARGSEILLGIICAVVVHRLILVREMSPGLLDLARRIAGRIDRFAAQLLDRGTGDDNIEAERKTLVAAYFEATDAQRSAFFESAEARLVNQPLHRLTEAAAQLLATAEMAAAHRHHAFRGTALADGVSAAPGAGEHDEPSAAALLRLADDRAIRSARANLETAIVAFEGRRRPATTKVSCKLWSDPLPAILAGIRAALAIGLTSALWFATAWPHGPVAVIVAAVACTLLAPLERPDKVTMAAAVTVLIASVLAFVTQFHFLPTTVDFPSMAVALAPLGLACAFILGQPRIGPLGLLAAVYFAFVSDISNVMTYDAASFLNASQAILVGIGVAIVLFATFFPETPVGASSRFRRQLLVHLRDLDSACGAAALPCYQVALYEQLGATLSRLKDQPALARQCIADAIAASAAADAISRLSAAVQGTLPTRFKDAGSRLLVRISQTVRAPSIWRLTKRAAEARALCRHALSAAEAKPTLETIEGLQSLAVACESLGNDLLSARVLLEKMSYATRT